jgi:hypothetical protein
MFAKGLTTGALAVLLAGGQLASAHMEISWPPVYRSKHNTKTPSGKIDSDMVAPLDPSGANYPCKGYHTDAEAKESTATFAPGGDYNFTVAGGADHGGGSCQVSLSYDGGKTFKVIQSIIGGCPQSSSYPFKIPADAPEGDAIWAWTWNNKIGNRELYMNCATVTIGGGGAKRAVEARQGASFDSRPDVFLANIGNGCSVPPGIDVEYPNPGPDVVNNGGSLGAPVGCAAGPGAGAGTGSGNDSGNQGGDAPSSTVQATVEPTAAPTPTNKLPGYVQTSLFRPPVRLTPITPTPNSASISASPSLPSSSGVFMTVGDDSSSSAPPAAPTTLVVSTKTPDAVVPKPTTDAPKPIPTGGAGSGSDSGSGSANAQGTPCTDEGAWNCIDGTAFQRCASGTWSSVQAVAAGTVCKVNGNKVLSIEAASAKLRRRFRNSAKLRL